ncbi:MAG: hypothetical protein PHQ40_06905 [Anaerolineaceae bacterium]|nr:hypothetical protein [Anaerolineaceae bacterium]
MRRIIGYLGVIFLSVLLAGCHLPDSVSGKTIFAGEHRLERGETLEGDLIVFGGNGTLEPGSVVTGSMIILGGQITSGGKVNSNVDLLIGSLKLLPSAEITGDLILAGGAVVGEEIAQIEGKVTRSPAKKTNGRAVLIPSPIAGRLITLLLELPLLAAFAAGVEHFFPRRLKVIQETALRYFWLCAALGALGWAVGLSLVVFMAYTILLLPVCLLGLGLIFLAATLGATAYARPLGGWLLAMLRWKVHPEGQILLGMTLLILMVELVRYIPFIGSVLIAVLLVTAFGAVLITRAGTSRFSFNLEEA